MIIRQPTNIYGLKYQPLFENSSYNQLDGFREYNEYVERTHPELCPLYHGGPGLETFTADNQQVLWNCLAEGKPKTILEIGVARDEPSSTPILTKGKLPESIYLGIDLRDTSFVTNYAPNCHTLQASSINFAEVEKKMFELGISSFDLIFIDGDHSINMASNDWRYAKYLSDRGFVIMHDINHHPVREIFLAVDENLFDKIALCPNDYGMGVIRKK